MYYRIVSLLQAPTADDFADIILSGDTSKGNTHKQAAHSTQGEF